MWLLSSGLQFGNEKKILGTGVLRKLRVLKRSAKNTDCFSKKLELAIRLKPKIWHRKVRTRLNKQKVDSPCFPKGPCNK